jgi:hypothetical protein
MVESIKEYSFGSTKKTKNALTDPIMRSIFLLIIATDLIMVAL